MKFLISWTESVDDNNLEILTNKTHIRSIISVEKTSKIKIFQAVQKCWLTFEFGLHQSSFNALIFLALFSFNLCIFFSAAFFFWEAKTFQEYAESVFFTSGLLNCALAFVIIVWEKRRIFDCLFETETLMNESKMNLNENIKLQDYLSNAIV